MAQPRFPQRTAPVVVGASLSFLPVLDLLGEALRRRQIRRSYGKMSDARLRDIGLTAKDVKVALSLPLDENAGDALGQSAAREAGRW